MAGTLVNISYRQCIVPECSDLPILAIIVEGKSRIGQSFRVATILTCSNHIDEGDNKARTYGSYSREISDNPPWLIREQSREEKTGWNNLIESFGVRRKGNEK